MTDPWLTITAPAHRLDTADRAQGTLSWAPKAPTCARATRTLGATSTGYFAVQLKEKAARFL